MHTVDANELDIRGCRRPGNPSGGALGMLRENRNCLGHCRVDLAGSQHNDVGVRDQGDGAAALIRFAVEHDGSREGDASPSGCDDGVGVVQLVLREGGFVHA